MYVSPKSESVFANLVNRFSRPVKLYRAAMKQALSDLGVDAKAYWSQRAGCSCGCSPAFILDKALGYDIFVSITEADQPVDRDPAKDAIAAARFAQVVADPTLPFGKER